MEKRRPRRYRTIAAFLPENLEARAAATQRELFRSEGMVFAEALPPFIPLHWCDDDPERLTRVLRHSAEPDARILPLTTGNWVRDPENADAGAPFGVAAAVKLLSDGDIGRLTDFLAAVSGPGPRLFGGYIGCLVLAVTAAQETLPMTVAAPEAITTSVLRLGLLDIEVQDGSIMWRLFGLDWLSWRGGG